MKKNLLAIAVGAALASPMMMPGAALADGPTVYGKVNLSLENVEDQIGAGNTQTDAQWQLDSNASRLGVKGDFDLDVGGLKAFYKAEFEIHPDDGIEASGADTDQVIDQRDIYGGVEGAFGAIQAGYFDSPLKDAQMDVDQFNDLDGDIKNILAGENRYSNQVMYSTPKLADMITLNASFIPGEGDDQDGDGQAEDGLADATSISIVLEKDIFYAGVARDTDVEDELLTDETGTSPTLDITRLVAGVNPGDFELGALYQVAEEAEGDGEETSYLLSGAFNIDRVKLKAQYGLTEGDQSEDELNLMAVGADYKLSKASKTYTYYSLVTLEPNTANAEDLDTTTFGVGVEHKF